MQPGLAIIGVHLYAPHAALNCTPELAPRFFIALAGPARREEGAGRFFDEKPARFFCAAAKPPAAAAF
jgi:hypothetical protein